MLLVITSQFIFAQSNEEKKHIREFSQPILRGTDEVERNMLSEASSAEGGRSRMLPCDIRAVSTLRGKRF